MLFGLFKKTDPICGMKETKDKGITKHGKWFCNVICLNKFEEAKKKHEKTKPSGCCD